MSVTTILSKGYPKANDDALTMWAAGEAAKCAIDYLPALVRASRRASDEPVMIGGREYRSAYDFLRFAATRKKEKASDLGGEIHNYIEAYILDKPYPDIEDEEVKPYLEGFQNFLRDWRPDFHATELVVANVDDGWAGTLDAHAMLPPARTPGLKLLDWKTGKGDRRAGKCEWPTSGLQQAAYSRAKIGWTKDGQEVKVPKVTGAYIVHIRPDHHPDVGYGVSPVDISDGIYQQFLNAKDMAGFIKDHAKKVLSVPEPIPRTTSE
jgi:hypothetical protein